MNQTVENFGRNFAFTPRQIYQPASESEVLEILRKHQGQQIRARGSLHAWSRGVETGEVLIDLSQLNQVQPIQLDGGWVAELGAGCQVKRALGVLGKQGLTFPSIGLIDEQTVAGATATGTHGSGNHSLSQFIVSARVARYNGNGEPEIVTIDSGDDLQAVRCSLGLLGVVVSLTFECRESYRVEEHSRRHRSLASVLQAEASYPLQQFFLMPWSWHLFGQHRVETQSARSRLAWLYRVYWLLGIDIGLHLIMFLLAKVLKFPLLIRSFYRYLLPLAIIRRWKVVDDSVHQLVMNHELFRHIEIEMFVARSQLEPATRFVVDVLRAFGGQQLAHRETSDLVESIGLSDSLALARGCYVHHYPICFRRLLSDDTLISMSTAGPDGPEDWYAISFISYEWPHDRAGFMRFSQFISISMARLFGARAHWGKVHPNHAETNRQLYPRFHRFCELCREADPEGRFRNDWTERVFGLAPVR